MATNYNLPKPVAGTSRAESPTETEILADVSDTVADIDTRITGEASTRASAVDALDTRVGSIEADYTTAADVDAAVDNATYEPLVESVTLSMADFRAGEITGSETASIAHFGSPAQGSWPSRSHPDGSNYSHTWVGKVPSHWASMHVDFIGGREGTVAGAATFRCDITNAAVGNLAGGNESAGTNVAVTATTQYAFQSTRLRSNVPIDPAKMVRIEIMRLAAGGDPGGLTEAYHGVFAVLTKAS